MTLGRSSGAQRSEDALVVGDAAADGDLVDMTAGATGVRFPRVARGRPSVRPFLQRSLCVRVMERIRRRRLAFGVFN